MKVKSVNLNTITPDSLPLLTTKKEELLPKVNLSLVAEPKEEKEKILKALAQVKGNKTKAAILLQIDRKTLYNKMHQYNIDL